MNLPEKPKPVSEGEGHHLKLRNLTLHDYADIEEIMNAVYPSLGGAWYKKSFKNLINQFAEGQICIEDNGKVVAAALSVIVNFDDLGDSHSYADIVKGGKFNSHDRGGETLYGIDVFVHPQFQNLRLGRRLYDARKELCENLNLRNIVVGGRISGYSEYKDKFSVGKYIQKVKKKEIFDPVLTFQLANDFHVRRILRDYIPDDTDSAAYATQLEWNNIYYEKEAPSLIGGQKSVIRAGLVQWQMRRVTAKEELLDQVEYFVDAISGYNADFILFPEFFNAPLMALNSGGENAVDALHYLASYSDDLTRELSRLAVSYNINIIAGSVPVLKENKLFNVSYLLRRDGTFDCQEKLHITKDERQYWGIQGGDNIKVFDTDIGKIGILICYDVEFPELSRILADQGVQILFIPYWTDTQNAYLRVRRCAQARAIENEIFVVMTGSCGNLPNVENMDIQYSQSAIFTPSDFSFPHDGIAAEATPNTEVTLIADLDLDLLKDLRNHGSVNNSKDRRNDLYRLEWKKK